ncbi:MAG: RDD family protein [Chitinophagaceae bacterium]
METTAIETRPVAEYPLLTDRIQSTFIDTVLIIILMFVFASFLDKIENPPDWIRIVLFFGLFAIYEPVCTALGFTLGNYIKKIRVRQFDNPGKRITLLQAFIRYIIKVLLGWISFLTMHGNKERRAIHDFAGGSVVIKI